MSKQNGIFIVTDFGADPNSNADDTNAIIACFDAATKWVKAGYPDRQARVEFPPGVYETWQPIQVTAGIDVRGDGRGTRIKSFGLGPAFVIGRKDVAGNANLRPDAYGVLDSIACPNRGQLHGIRTDGKICVQFEQCPADKGRFETWDGGGGWDHLSHEVVTIEILLGKPPGTQWDAKASLLGLITMAGGSPTCRPWGLGLGDDANTLRIYLNDNKGEDPTQLGCAEFDAPGLDGPGPWRITIQTRFDGSMPLAWINGQPSAVRGPFDRRTWTKWGQGTHSGLNLAQPFTLGGWGIDYTAPIDVWGMSVYRGEIYKNQPGLQTRIDGLPVNDRTRYFPEAVGKPTSTLVWYLPLDEKINGQAVSISDYRGIRGACGWWRKKDGQFGDLRNTLEGLNVWSRGPSVMIEPSYDTIIRDCQLTSEIVAICSSTDVAAYPLTVRDCEIGGQATAVDIYRQLATFDNIKITRCGYDAWRIRDSKVQATAVLNAGGSSRQVSEFTFIPGEYASRLIVSNYLCNNEAWAYAGPIVRGWLAPLNRSTISLADFQMGSTNGNPLVQLVGRELEGEYRFTGLVSLTRVEAGAPVMVDAGINWGGVVESVADGPPAIKQDSGSSVKITTNNPG